MYLPPFMTIKKLVEVTGWSRTAILRAIQQEEIPVLPNEIAGSTYLIDCHELQRRIDAGQFTVPTSKK
ncbi:hypothetical protein [Vibrio sp. VB16]|uniref:hypothetical protein n=1 Tax=Vibrio sp. VB16 TaxID=2785746 RepID=UPI00189D6433|nr:hypothetical protein [Vibrio sp. VB16]UGA55305.1 hypothetical protein IUZ65_002835 [Vibrio sp. VB16]